MSKNKYCPKYGRGFEFLLLFSFKRLKSNSIEDWQKVFDLRQPLESIWSLLFDKPQKASEFQDNFSRSWIVDKQIDWSDLADTIKCKRNNIVSSFSKTESERQLASSCLVVKYWSKNKNKVFSFASHQWNQCQSKYIISLKVIKKERKITNSLIIIIIIKRFIKSNFQINQSGKILNSSYHSSLFLS